MKFNNRNGRMINIWQSSNYYAKNPAHWNISLLLFHIAYIIYIVKHSTGIKWKLKKKKKKNIYKNI